MSLQNAQDQPVDSDPSFAKKHGKKALNLPQRHQLRKQRDYPILAQNEHLDSYQTEMVRNCRQFLFQQSFDYVAMIIKSGKARHMNRLQVIVIERPYRQFKGEHFTAVEIQTGNNVVHTLQIARAARVFRKGVQNFGERFSTFSLWIGKEGFFGVRSRNVCQNLPFIGNRARFQLHSPIHLTTPTELDQRICLVFDQGNPFESVFTYEKFFAERNLRARARRKTFRAAKTQPRWRNPMMGHLTQRGHTCRHRISLPKAK